MVNYLLRRIAAFIMVFMMAMTAMSLSVFADTTSVKIEGTTHYTMTFQYVDNGAVVSEVTYHTTERERVLEDIIFNLKILTSNYPYTIDKVEANPWNLISVPGPPYPASSVVTFDETFTEGYLDLTITQNGSTKVFRINAKLSKNDTATVTPPTANTLTYNGSPQVLITAGSAVNGRLKYAVVNKGESAPWKNNSSAWTKDADKITATDAGTYTVYYYAEGDSSSVYTYNDSETESLDVTINPKEDPAKTILLVGKVSSKGETQAKFSWNGMTDADRYVVYYAKSSRHFKKYKTFGSKRRSVTKKDLKKGTAYKFMVVAQKKVDGKYKKIAESRPAHLVVGNTSRKYTNQKELEVSETSITLAPGQTYKIKAAYKKFDKKKKLLTQYAKRLRYSSSSKEIAKVNSNGEIKGVSIGICKVYVQTINGKWKAIDVKVIQ